MSGTDTVTVTVIVEFVDGGTLGVFRTASCTKTYSGVVSRFYGAPLPTFLESLPSNLRVVGQVGNVKFSGKRLSVRTGPLQVRAVAVASPRVYVI